MNLGDDAYLGIFGGLATYVSNRYDGAGSKGNLLARAIKGGLLETRQCP
jgi:hypothetical protein